MRFLRFTMSAYGNIRIDAYPFCPHSTATTSINTNINLFLSLNVSERISIDTFNSYYIQIQGKCDSISHRNHFNAQTLIDNRIVPDENNIIRMSAVISRIWNLHDTQWSQTSNRLRLRSTTFNGICMKGQRVVSFDRTIIIPHKQTCSYRVFAYTFARNKYELAIDHLPSEPSPSLTSKIREKIEAVEVSYAPVRVVVCATVFEGFCDARWGVAGGLSRSVINDPFLFRAVLWLTAVTVGC